MAKRKSLFDRITDVAEEVVSIRTDIRETTEALLDELTYLNAQDRRLTAVLDASVDVAAEAN